MTAGGLSFTLTPIADWDSIFLDTPGRHLVEGVPGDIAQLGERGVRNAEVGGSSPPISTSVPL